MAYTVYEHLIYDCSNETKFNNAGQLIYAKIDRTYLVDGITDVPSKEILQAAQDYIKTIVAPGAAHPVVTDAKAFTYRSAPVNSDRAAMVIVTFNYELGGNPTTYTIEMSAGLQGVTTNLEYDDSNNGKPIFVTHYPFWLDKTLTGSARGLSREVPVHLPVLKPVTSVVLTKSCSKAVSDSLEAIKGQYMGWANSTTFRGEPAGTQLVTGIATSSSPYNGIYIARLSFGHRPETWDEYARVTSTEFGVPNNIWLAKTGTGAHEANGIKLCKVYKRTNLQTLVDMV